MDCALFWLNVEFPIMMTPPSCCIAPPSFAACHSQRVQMSQQLPCLQSLVCIGRCKSCSVQVLRRPAQQLSHWIASPYCQRTYTYQRSELCLDMIGWRHQHYPAKWCNPSAHVSLRSQFNRLLPEWDCLMPMRGCLRHVLHRHRVGRSHWN